MVAFISHQQALMESLRGWKFCNLYINIGYKIKEELLQQAAQLITHLEQANKSISVPHDVSLVNPILILKNLLLQADESQGGFGNAP